MTNSRTKSHSSIWVMLRRIAAIFFILLIAANAWGAVCGCLGGGGVMKMPSCCKREKAGRTAMSAKPCCESNCIIRGNSQNFGIKAEFATRIPTPHAAINEAVIHAEVIFRAAANDRLPEITKYRGPNLPRPPDLYIKNKSFLI